MIILCDADPGIRDELARQLQDGGPITHLTDLPSARAAADQAVQPTVVILGPHVDVDSSLSFAASMEHGSRAVAVVLVRRSLDTSLMRQALRSGVSDVLVVDEITPAEMQDVLMRAREDARERGPAHVAGDADDPGGRVVTVFSTKGGCGKSLVASNLAILLGRAGHRTVLVDLDLQSGDLAIMLQILPTLTIHDAAPSAHRLDAEAMRGYLTQHPAGVSVLAAPTEPAQAEAVTAPAVASMLTLLRTMFDHVVVDGPAFFTDQILSAIDQSDTVIIVGSLDVPSVKSLRTALTTIEQLGHTRDHILTVLNRADSNVGLRVSEVEKSLGTAVDVQLPSSRDVPLSINQGAPLAMDRPRSDVVQAIAQLLPKMGVEDASSGSRSIFSRRR